MARSISASSSRLLAPVAIVLAIAMSLAGGTTPRRSAGHGRDRAPRASRSATQRLEADHGAHGSADTDWPVLSPGDGRSFGPSELDAPDASVAVVAGAAPLFSPTTFTCLAQARVAHVPTAPACASLSDRGPPLS